MEDLHSQSDPKALTETLLPWHKPEIERLTVSLDTANGVTSGTDGFKTGFAAND